MARRKITNSQAVCITLLWGILCYMMLAYSEKDNLRHRFCLGCVSYHCVRPLSIRAEGEETSDI